MENIVRTVFLADLQNSMLRGAIYEWKEKTTLNEKFGVQAGVYPATDTYPILNFMFLGTGAMGMEIGADGEKDPLIYQHRSTDGALFKHLPWVLRTLDNDLTPEERANYCMRQLVTYNSVQYWAYWGKRVNFSQEQTEMYITSIVNGQTVIDTFVPSDATLNPVIPDMSEAGVNLLRGKKVTASAQVTLPIDEFDINEIRNASKIIRGTVGKANVSEIALCSGRLNTIDIPVQGGTARFEEAIGVQVLAFVACNYPLDYVNQSLENNLELGISEPLFNIEGENS